MNRVSRAVLARRLSAAIRDAACAGRGHWWSEQEAAHARASTPARAAAAGAAALTVCGGCSEVRRCAQRAAVDRYTGLAAGAVYVHGVRRGPATVLRRPSPPDLEQAG